MGKYQTSLYESNFHRQQITKLTFKGGFPLSRNFYVRTDVNFNLFEPRSTFTFTRGFSYITSILINARKAS